MNVTVYSPRAPSVEQDIPLLLRHPLPPPPRFCALLPAASPPRTVEEGEPAPPPPLWNRMVFPFVNVWPFYLPTPLLWKRMVFPFALRHIYIYTYTHTHHVSVYVWRSLSVHALLLSLRSILYPPFTPPWYLSCTLVLQ